MTAAEFIVIEPLREDPALCAAFVYCVLGGVGPIQIRALFLKVKFDALAPWDRVNVIHILRDILDGHMRGAGAVHSRAARALDDQGKV